MKCREIRLLVMSYADNEAISALGMNIVREHVAACPKCRKELADIGFMKALLAAQPRSTASPGTVHAVMTNVRAHRRPVIYRFMPVAVAAAAVLLIAFTVNVLTSERVSPVSGYLFGDVSGSEVDYLHSPSLCFLDSSIVQKK